MDFNIRDYIPYGEDLAINRRTLSKRTGLSDRTIRDFINKANKEEGDPIINLGHGYFMPKKEEYDLVLAYIQSERARIRDIQEKVDNITKMVNINA